MANPAPSAEWGKDSSRGEIICTYCGKGMRKDNLTRHTQTYHPGKKESWKLKSLEGQKSLTSFFCPKPPGGAKKVVTSTPIKDYGDKCDKGDISFDDEDMSKDVSPHTSPNRLAPGLAVSGMRMPLISKIPITLLVICLLDNLVGTNLSISPKQELSPEKTKVLGDNLPLTIFPKWSSFSLSSKESDIGCQA